MQSDHSATFIGSPANATTHRIRPLLPVASRSLVLAVALGLAFVSSTPAQTPDDQFDYRSHGLPTNIFDWNTLSFLSPQQIALVNRRARLIVESPAKEDVQDIATSVTAINNDNISFLKFRSGSILRTMTELDEATFLHSTNHPGSLVGFAISEGVELHWLPDRRKDYSAYVDGTHADAYRVYRVDGNGLQVLIGSLTLGENDAPSFIDSGPADGTFEYKIRTVIDGRECALDSVTVAYPGALSDKYWIERMAVAQSDPTMGPDWLYIDIGAWTASPESVVCNVCMPRSLPGVPADQLRMTREGGVDGRWSYHLAKQYTDTLVTNWFNGFAVSFGVGTPEVQVPLFGGQYFTTSPNNRIRMDVFDEYAMNRGHPNWQAAWKADATDLLRRSQERSYDGLYGDSGETSLWGVNVRPVDIYGGSNYQESLLSMLGAVHQWSESELAVFMLNGLQSRYYMDNLTWASLIDGVSMEGFAYVTSDQFLLLGDRWLLQMQLMQAAASNTPATLKYVNALAQAPVSDVEARIYGLASYLLIAGPKTAYCARGLGEGPEPSMMSYVPEAQLNLGAAVTLPNFGAAVSDTVDLDLAHLKRWLPGSEYKTFPPLHFSRNYGPSGENVVIVNATDFSDWPYREETRWMYPFEGTKYRVELDGKSILDGGRFWTVAVSDSVSLFGGQAAILLNDPVRSPEVDPEAIYPLFSVPGATSVLAAHASHWDGSRLWVEVDGSALGLGSAIRLSDDGEGNDLAADDGIYSSASLSVTAAAGVTYSLPVYARGDDGIAVYDTVNVVVAASKARFVEVGKTVTNLTYEGRPYSSVTLDGNSGQKSLMISIQDYASQLYSYDHLDEATSGPVFALSTASSFPDVGSRPQAGLRGMAAADYDNDGNVDFFAAAASGARLYHNSGNGTFEDRADSLGLAPFCVDSWTGAWGDADRDGAIDLFVGTASSYPDSLPKPGCVFPEGDHLLKNNVGPNGAFVDISAASHVDFNTACLSAAWADIDGDKDLDLVVGNLMDWTGPGLSALVVYINYGEGTFVDANEAMMRIPYSSEVQGISGVAFADMDNDGDQDLCLSTQANYYKQPWVMFNNGLGYFNEREPVRLPLSTETVGLRPFDQDLDGRMDLLLLPWREADAPWLFANRLVDGIVSMRDETDVVGLSVAGRADGAVVADFTGDGDPELYLGRPSEADKCFYRSVRWDGSDAPAANWVGVRLDPNSGANNESGIGSTVTVTVGDPLAPVYKQAQIVDGGSGRGSQADGTLIFGLGELEGVVQAKVRWPGGYVQTQQLVVGTVNVISDLTVPTMVILRNQSPVFTYEVIPGTELIDWIFTWQTEFSCDPSLDQVRVSCRPNQPSTCLCDERTLHVGDENVQARVWAKTNGRYEHSFRWSGVPCSASCSYNFTMGSATQRSGSLSEVNMVGTISFCPTDFDPAEE